MSAQEPLADLLSPLEALTADRYFALPARPRELYELYDGMLVFMTLPDMAHAAAKMRLGVTLHRYGEERGGTGIFGPIGVTLADDLVLVPDVVYVAARSRARVVTRGIEGPPDLVVEVASPSTRRYDMHTKLPAYFEHGVREVWIVDPGRRTVTVHWPGEAPASVTFGQEIPSQVVQIGSAGLERIAALEDEEPA
jgi:Uma2 family endonuclease